MPLLALNQERKGETEKEREGKEREKRKREQEMEAIFQRACISAVGRHLFKAKARDLFVWQHLHMKG